MKEPLVTFFLNVVPHLLASLFPGSGEDGLACGGHARMGIADDELDAMQAAFDEGREAWPR